MQKNHNVWMYGLSNGQIMSISTERVAAGLADKYMAQAIYFFAELTAVD